MSDPSQHDVWAIGEGYERYVGRWSRLVAPKFIQWLAVPGQLKWLDVGCGTGALTKAILQQASPVKVVGVDPSDGFLASARAQVADARAEFRQGDGQALPAGDGEFDVVVSGLVLNFIPDEPKALGEMRRVARGGGTVAAYVWDYAEGMQMMRHFWDAAVALNPAAGELDEARRFPRCRPEPLLSMFRAGGLRDVTSAAIDVPTEFKDFDDYWSPFLGGQGPAPGYCVKLPEPERVILRDRIRKSLPIESNGRIALTARAWCVRGVK
jgi:SAM-dependent methyltransferase